MPCPAPGSFTAPVCREAWLQGTLQHWVRLPGTPEAAAPGPGAGQACGGPAALTPAQVAHRRRGQQTRWTGLETGCLFPASVFASEINARLKSWSWRRLSAAVMVSTSHEPRASSRLEAEGVCVRVNGSHSCVNASYACERRCVCTRACVRVNASGCPRMHTCTCECAHVCAQRTALSRLGTSFLSPLGVSGDQPQSPGAVGRSGPSAHRCARLRLCGDPAFPARTTESSTKRPLGGAADSLPRRAAAPGSSASPRAVARAGPGRCFQEEQEQSPVTLADAPVVLMLPGMG